MENFKEIIASRSIKVFLSSTFKDMQSERDYLAKNTFMELEAEAKKKNVTLNLLDLRWGITEEQSQHGLVTQICLQEIEKSRPFFIGIIGDRYGWIPEKQDISDDSLLFQKYPWVKKDIEQGLSITEIEIQYGVLRNKDSVNALFYIKSSKGNRLINDEEQKKLNRLKSLVSSQTKYPVKYYDTPQELGKMIKEDMSSIIDSIFPTFQEVDPLKELDFIQNSILSSKANNYVEINSSMSHIDSFLLSPYSGLNILGESGTGKSSLLANWIKKNEQSGFHVLYHFVDKTNDGDNYGVILLRFYYKICEILKVKVDADWTKLAFEEYVGKINEILATSNEKFLFIIDALNQLDPASNAFQLQWFPKTSSNIKIICSTTNDNSELNHALQFKSFQKHEMTPVPDAETVSKLSDCYLYERFGKKLTFEQIKKITSNNLFHNPLFLFSLFEELRLFGNYELLNNKIEELCSCQSKKEFVLKVIDRIEIDTQQIDSGIVKNMLILLSISRCGIEIKEIKEILHCSYTETLSVLYMCQRFMSILGNSTNITHSQLKETVKKLFVQSSNYKYVCEEYGKYLEWKINNSKNREHLTILLDICHFYYTTEKYSQLYRICVSLDSFRLLNFFGGHNNETYWKKLTEKGHSLSDLLPQFNSANDFGDIHNILHELSLVRSLCANIHDLNGYRKCLEFCYIYYKNHRDKISESDNNLLKLDLLTYHVRRGDAHEVIKLADELIKINPNDDNTLLQIKARALGYKAQFIRQSNIKEASNCLLQSVDLFLKAKFYEGAIAAYINDGLFNAQSGIFNHALHSYKEALDLCSRKMRESPGLILQKYNCLTNMSALYGRMGQIEKQDNCADLSKLCFLQILNSQYASRLAPSRVAWYHSTTGFNMMLDGKIKEGKEQIQKGIDFIEGNKNNISKEDYELAIFDLKLSLAKGYGHNKRHVDSIKVLLENYEDLMSSYQKSPDFFSTKFSDYNYILACNCKDLNYTKAAIYYLNVIINNKYKNTDPSILSKCWEQIAEVYLIDCDYANVELTLEKSVEHYRNLTNKDSVYLPNLIMSLIRRYLYSVEHTIPNRLTSEETKNKLSYISADKKCTEFKQYLVLHILLNEYKNDITDDIVTLFDENILSVSSKSLTNSIINIAAVYDLLGEYCDNIGSYFMFEKNNAYRAIEFAEYSLAYFSQITGNKYLIKQIYSLHHLANYFDTVGEKNKALEKYEHAISLVESSTVNTPEYICRKSSLLYDYAVALYQNNIVKSEQLLKQAIRNIGDLYIDSLEASRILADAQETLANIYDDTERYNDAENMYKSSIFILERLKEHDGMASRLGKAYNNYGIMFAKQGQIDEAINKLQKSREIRQKTDPRGLINTDSVLFRVSMMCNRKMDAFNYLAEIISTEEKYDILRCGLLNEYVNYIDSFAQLSIELGRSVEGKKAYRKAFDLLKLSNMGRIPSDNYLKNFTAIATRVHELFGTTNFLNN